jgi:hypothetical protein
VSSTGEGWRRRGVAASSGTSENVSLVNIEKIAKGLRKSLPDLLRGV